LKLPQVANPNFVFIKRPLVFQRPFFDSIEDSSRKNKKDVGMKIYRIAINPKVHNRRLRDQGDLKAWKMYCHTLFDKIWRYWDSDISRDQAYQMLADYLGVPEPKAHMSTMSIEQLQKTAEWAKRVFDEMYSRRTRQRHRK
jgi:hypothetical protein